MSELLTRIRGSRAIWPLLALVAILIVDGFISPNFFNIRIVEGRLFGNIIDIFYRAVPTALVALGMALVIGTKGIDLSVGAIIAIAGAVIAWRIKAGDPHGLILIWSLLVAMICGGWNGFLVAGLGIQPIIATLILMVSGRGVGMLINLLYGGTNPSFESALLQGLSTGSIWLIPTRIVLFAVIFAVLWFVVRKTALGLFVEATGGNAAASQLAGVNARMITFAAYAICGLMAGWAGIILTADIHTSDPVSVGLYIELDAILAVVIGGGSLAGGRIYLGMTVIGALVIQALTTSILISGLPPEYNLIIKALVVLFVLTLQSENARRGIANLFTRSAK
ncbi:MAG: ABC transporter permease [Rhodobacteraceae bacterium]|nr:ABC transporter permease [Paracoccaceae bacterium]PHR53643.1 MAG: sugar ABC transporter permease [Robiginitomaculum sp.]